MTELLTIRQEGDQILRAVAQPVMNFASIPMLAEQMLATMIDAGGLGLAAPQIGMSIRLIVCRRDGRQLVMANPSIVYRRGTFWSPEGCLSISPDKWGPPPVRRSASIRVEYQDVFGVKQTARATNHMAGCVQHEIDHLDGILFTDYRVKKC